MKKYIALILCLLLLGGCSQSADEGSSSPSADATTFPDAVAATATSDAVAATSTPEQTQSFSWTIPPNGPLPTPMPTPILEGQTASFENIFTYHFNSKNDAVLKTPKDFATEEELNEFIYQDCLSRHENLKRKKPDALFLHISLMGSEMLPPEFSEIESFDMDVILTDKELINEWFSFVKTVKLKKNESYQYDPEYPLIGIGPDITYCYKNGSDIIELFTDSFQYYYPNDVKIHYPVTYADWDEKTREKYSEFENKIYQLAADKFKAAYEQAANYPFLN